LTRFSPLKLKEIQRLKEEREQEKSEKQKQKEESEKQEAEKQLEVRVSAYKGEIKKFLEGAGDKFELLIANGDDEDPAETVYNTIVEYYDLHKEVLSHEAAAEMVEKYLEAKAEKLSKTKKLSSKLAPPSAEEKKQDSGSSNSPKTLENTHSSTVPNRQAKKLSTDERIAQAASLVRWTK
jgi:hypothetical protein